MTTITIKVSPIHGRGIFAARDINPGEVLIDWGRCKENLTPQDVQELSAEARKRVSVIDGQHILFHPPACYVNHSCGPNARVGNECDIAIRAIKTGEEITVDYVAENVPDLNFPCNCGATKCRHTLS